MKLVLERLTLSEDCTMGRLYINDDFFCDTLEDKDRGVKQTDPIEDIRATKVYGQTAIPKGRYSVSYSPSNRFKKDMPRIDNVPGFEGILFHGGNKIDDTFGCILLGTYDNDNPGHLKFGSSLRAESFRNIIRTHWERNEVIEITIK